MAARKKKRPAGKTFRFQLTLAGIFGIGIVCFCLFMWMFLLGIWAGQTILLPAARPPVAGNSGKAMSAVDGTMPVERLDSAAKKKPGANDRKR